MRVQRPRSEQQREQLLADMGKAIDRIADAWPFAVDAALSAGWPSSSPGFGGPTVRRVTFDETGAVISDERVYAPLVADPTGEAALRGTGRASDWLRSSRASFRLLIRLSPAFGQVLAATDCPGLLSAALSARSDLVDTWPLHAERLIARLFDLADTADVEWPRKPREGDVIGEVKVGGRYVELATCAECRHPITDQVDNYGGRAYHRKPCGKVVRERARRQARK